MALTQRGFLSYDGNHAPNWPFTLNKDSPQAQGLIAWWPGVPHGSTALDQSGFDHDLDFLLQTTMSPMQLGALAYEFDGVGDEISKSDGVKGNLIHLRNQDFSFHCRSINRTSGENSLGTFFDCTGIQKGWKLIIRDVDATPRRLQVGMRNSGTDGLQVTNDTQFEDGGELHSGFRYTVSDRNVNIFNAGVQQSLVTDDISANTGLTDASGPLQLGNDISNGNRALDGWLFDVRIYNWSLPDALFWQMYNPSTRWDLYHELGRKSYFLPVVAAAGANPKGPLGMPLHGPFGGPV